EAAGLLPAGDAFGWVPSGAASGLASPGLASPGLASPGLASPGLAVSGFAGSAGLAAGLALASAIRRDAGSRRAAHATNANRKRRLRTTMGPRWGRPGCLPETGEIRTGDGGKTARTWVTAPPAESDRAAIRRAARPTSAAAGGRGRDRRRRSATC